MRDFFKHYLRILSGYTLVRLLRNYRRSCRTLFQQGIDYNRFATGTYFATVVDQYANCMHIKSHTRLLEKADALVKLPFLTVSDKTMLPPSQVGNDYLSFAPYYWHRDNPDPFSKPKVEKYKKDGRPNPALTKLSDKPRLAQMCARIHLLTLAYQHTEERKYLDYIIGQLTCWFIASETRMNPHMEYAQIMPWRNHHRGLGIIDARWLILLIDAIAILRSKDALDKEIVVALADWIKQFSLWILTSPSGLLEVAKRNNRGSWVDALLTYTALVLGIEQAATSIAVFGIKNRPREQFDKLMLQPLEMRRYNFVSYSLYNIYPLFYLLNVLHWKYSSVKNDERVDAINRETSLLKSAVKLLQEMIPAHELNHIESIEFNENFSLNLYYPYCFAQLSNFPGIYPFPASEMESREGKFSQFN